ncbi:hypothetical protein SUDANB21_04047 [Streptomyces sp. enrichment culture]|jgi:predicted DNA-binding transcriptional regulator AlpA
MTQMTLMTQKSAPRTDTPLNNPGYEEPLMASPQMLKLPEVLTEIGMSRAAFYRMRARGQAPRLVKLPNGHLRVRRSDLDDWLSNLDSPAY